MSRRTLASRVIHVMMGSFFAITATVYTGCDDEDGNCHGGHPCECSGYDECYLDCYDSDCELIVHDVVHGEGACGNYCDSNCFGVTDCSLWCDDACSSEVHSAVSAETVCGNLCEHQCFDVERCEVTAGTESHIRCHNVATCDIERVGPGSTVECHSVSSCRVACDGECRLEYTAIGSGQPQLVCPDSAPLTKCSETVLACGDCAR